MIRVAVVGVGTMGRNHARVYHELPDAELVAVVDLAPRVATEVGRLYGAAAYSDLDEMLLRAKPDAVSLVVPTIAHHALALRLLEAGCHLLVEKPIAATLEDAESMVEAAAVAGRVLMVGHIERFNPAVVELKRRLSADALGRLYQINVRRLGPFPRRIGDVGVVMDLATHDLDIMRYLTGDEAVRVYGETRRKLHQRHEDLLSGMVTFSGGTLGLLEINWLTPTKIRDLCVTGEGGMFLVDYITQDLSFYENAEAANGEGWPTLNLLRGVSEGVIIRYPIRREEPLKLELQGFLGAIRGEPCQGACGADGLAAVELAQALIVSAATCQPKELIHDGHRASATADAARASILAGGSA